MIVFIDESGISERPTRVRTCAPKGQTPIIQFHFNWNHVSVIAGLTRTNCLFRLHEGSIKKEQVVEFLKALKAHLKQHLLVILDGLRAHRSKLVREYLDGLNGHIQLAFLPPYAVNNACGLWPDALRHCANSIPIAPRPECRFSTTGFYSSERGDSTAHSSQLGAPRPLV